MVSLVGDLPRAARNIWSLSFGDGIEPYAPAPSTVVYDEPHRCLRRFDRDEPSTQRPVLLVPPLAVTPACFDLRDGQSFVRFLLETGRQPYVIDYGQMTYADRDLGLEEWTHDIVPTAIRRVSQEHDGAGVDVVGWSLGGILAVLAGAGHADLPIASITAIAPPFDQRKTVTVAPLRILGAVTGGREVDLATRVFGGIPSYIVRTGFRVQAFQRELTRPLFVARNILDEDALARMEAIDRFMAMMPGYPGRLYRQIHRSFILRNELVTGTIRLRSDLVVETAKLTCPVLILGSRTDLVVPAAAARAGVDVLTGADVRFEEVPGGHLGILAGPAARETTWRVIDEFLSR
ncbi:alpha/beta fold hydrolase [Nocardia cyriacigeorgica]|uniref:Poly-beta-hydroxybutyrate polymerase n=1 Tax=Nocardia cyriacigeorgica TaxID=135487 RepID=A0A4U8W7W2_9NOCA|nr:alpha/beta fold hydrolase [Nocardia cyriacigeorgica]VFA98337.1 Poly-beta-hydroxybutyrate polymerase [Nocardia cyriacigeorgica]